MMLVTAMEVLIVADDGEVVRALAGTLINAGHTVFRVDAEYTTTSLAALSPVLLVVTEAALASPSVRTAIDLHRGARSMAVVVLGESARGLTDVRLLPVFLSTDEIVRQVLAVNTHDTVTRPPPADDSRRAPARMDSGPSPRGLTPWPSERPVRESSRPTATNMPQVVPGAVPPPVLHSLVSERGKVFEIEADVPLSIGRGVENHVVLEDRGISRSHACIEGTPRGPLLRDLGSAHGVHLNGVPVTEHPLEHGDCVQVGRFVFHLVRGGRAAAAQWHRARGASTEPTGTRNEQSPGTGAAMRGELSVVELPALVQMLIAQRRSGELLLTENGLRLGAFHFVDGRPIHAETATGATGVEAFYALLPAVRGQFAFLVGVEPPTATIDATATALMLEGCRRLADERTRTG